MSLSDQYIINLVFGGLAELFGTYPTTEKCIAKPYDLRSQYKPKMKAGLA